MVKITNILFLTLILTVNVLNSQKKIIEEQMKRKVDSIFTNYQKEKFIDNKDIYIESGWNMELLSGRIVTRSFLMNQAAPVITLGSNAVPFLFSWVMNDNLAVRYIAVYALQQITGLNPFISHFDKEDAANNREKAIKIWEDWWIKQNIH